MIRNDVAVPIRSNKIVLLLENCNTFDLIKSLFLLLPQSVHDLSVTRYRENNVVRIRTIQTCIYVVE